MSKLKKYKFWNSNRDISISFNSNNDKEAIIKLGSIVNNVGQFTKMRKWKVK